MCLFVSCLFFVWVRRHFFDLECLAYTQKSVSSHFALIRFPSSYLVAAG